MGLKGRPPETGPRGLTFTHDKCHGKPRVGWLSGDIHLLECHVGDDQKSKPCEKVLLGTDAPCPGCKPPRRAVETVGFVPLRDQTGKPTVVLVRKQQILFIAKMKLGIPVTYGREEGRYESVYVIHRLVDQKWENYFSHDAEDNLMPWLATFLGVAHLAPAMRHWFETGECQPVVTEQTAPVPVVESLPPTVGELTVGIAGVIEIPPLGDTTRRLDAKKEREKRNADFVRSNGKK
jgi:hypothetical protein